MKKAVQDEVMAERNGVHSLKIRSAWCDNIKALQEKCHKGSEE